MPVPAATRTRDVGRPGCCPTRSCTSSDLRPAGRSLHRIGWRRWGGTSWCRARAPRACGSRRSRSPSGRAPTHLGPGSRSRPWRPNRTPRRCCARPSARRGDRRSDRASPSPGRDASLPRPGAPDDRRWFVSWLSPHRAVPGKNIGQVMAGMISACATVVVIAARRRLKPSGYAVEATSRWLTHPCSPVQGASAS